VQKQKDRGKKRSFLLPFFVAIVVDVVVAAVESSTNPHH